MKLFLDSSAIIEFFKNNQHVVDAVGKADELYTSSLCAYEVLFGEKYREEKGLVSHYNYTLMFFETIATISFTYHDAIIASGIMAKLALKGRKVAEIDALIAAQAIGKEAIVLTTDAKHFKIMKEEIGLLIHPL